MSNDTNICEIRTFCAFICNGILLHAHHNAAAQKSVDKQSMCLSAHVHVRTSSKHIHLPDNGIVAWLAFNLNYHGRSYLDLIDKADENMLDYNLWVTMVTRNIVATLRLIS